MFAVKRGEIGKRFDVRFNNTPQIGGAIKFGVIITDIYRYPTFYGISYLDRGIPVIKGENISRDGDWIKYSKIDFIDNETNAKFPRSILKENDLVMTVRGEVGKVALVNKELDGGNINANVIKISLSDSAYPAYVWRYLNSSIGKSQIRLQLSGGVQETITVSSINDIAIILPQYETQVKLATELSLASQNCATKLRKADELLAGMDGFVLKQLGIGDIPVQERITVGVTLGTLKSDNNIGAAYYHPERIAVIRAIENNSAVSTCRLADIVDFQRKTISADNGEPYLGLAGVSSNTGELSGVEEEASGQAFEYQRGDVLYARLRPYLNKILYAETNGICSTEFHVMRVKCNDVLPEYLSVIMRSKIIVSQTRHMMTGNTHPRISNDDVSNLRIPIPEKAVQEKIVKEAVRRKVKARKFRYEAETEWIAAKERFERELMEG